jgi:hypothetical protein
VLSHCGPHGLIVLIKLVSDAVLVGNRERSHGRSDNEGHEFTHVMSRLRSGHLAAEGRTVFEARRGPRASVKAPLGAARERRQGTSPMRIVIYELPDRPLADFRKTAENGCVLGCQGRIEGL